MSRPDEHNGSVARPKLFEVVHLYRIYHLAVICSVLENDLLVPDIGIAELGCYRPALWIDNIDKRPNT